MHPAQISDLVPIYVSLSWRCAYGTRVLQVPIDCAVQVYVGGSKAKEKYRGVFEIQRSGDKTSSGEIGLDIRTHASPKVGQDQVSGGVSVLKLLGYLFEYTTELYKTYTEYKVNIS